MENHHNVKIIWRSSWGPMPAELRLAAGNNASAPQAEMPINTSSSANLTPVPTQLTSARSELTQDREQPTTTKKPGNRDTGPAQKRAATVNAAAGGPMARREDKTNILLSWLSKFNITTDGVAADLLGVQRSGFASELADEMLLEKITSRSPRRDLYALSRVGAQLVDRAYINPAKYLGNLRHRLAVQRETLLVLEAAELFKLDTNRFLVEPAEGAGKKRSDVKFFKLSGHPIRLEVELSRKDGIELLKLIRHVGDGYNRCPVLITFKDQKLLMHFLTHVFDWMDKGKIPELQQHEREKTLVKVSENNVDTYEAFKNAYVKINGQPWLCDKSQNLIEIFLRRKTES